MHVDHILATNSKKADDDEFNKYVDKKLSIIPLILNGYKHIYRNFYMLRGR